MRVCSSSALPLPHQTPLSSTHHLRLVFKVSHLSSRTIPMATPPAQRKLSRTKATRNPEYKPVSFDDISSRGSFRIRGGRDLAIVCRELNLGPDDFGIDEALYAQGMSASLSSASSSSPHHQLLPSHQQTDTVGPTDPLGRQQEAEVEVVSTQQEAEEEDDGSEPQDGGASGNDENEIEESESEVVEETVGGDGGRPVVKLDSNGDDDDAARRIVVEEVGLSVSPNGTFKRVVRSWIKGSLLGSGSFGMVYEAISE